MTWLQKEDAYEARVDGSPVILRSVMHVRMCVRFSGAVVRVTNSPVTNAYLKVFCSILFEY